jgi:uncharacterized membrane protein
MQQFAHFFRLLNNKKKLAFIFLFLLIISWLLVYRFLIPVEANQQEDIYYLWLEGKRLLSEENPYARVLSGNMRENNKYATYFPLFYIMSYLTQLLGLKNYSDWLNFWHNIFLIFNLGIALIIFYIFYEYGLVLLAFFSALFWLFNRWTLHVTSIAHIDFIPLFFLILSLLIFRRHKWLSLVLFSLSLSVKQIGIFLAPLYLIWIWQSESKSKFIKVLIACAIILSIPLLTSLPFIFWNSEGFFKSILFSATRNPDSHFSALSLDAYIKRNITEFVGIKAKIPMLFLMALIYFSALRRQLGMYTSSLLTMSVFINFNSVLFLQYMCWVVPFIPLCVCDQMHEHQ